MLFKPSPTLFDELLCTERNICVSSLKPQDMVSTFGAAPIFSVAAEVVNPDGGRFLGPADGAPGSWAAVRTEHLKPVAAAGDLGPAPAGLAPSADRLRRAFFFAESI